MARYERMDLADMVSEAHARCQVLTVYRRNDRQVIDFVAPPRA
jgi:hypothetical protein